MFHWLVFPQHVCFLPLIAINNIFFLDERHQPAPKKLETSVALKVTGDQSRHLRCVSLQRVATMFCHPAAVWRANMSDSCSALWNIKRRRQAREQVNTPTALWGAVSALRVEGWWNGRRDGELSCPVGRLISGVSHHGHRVNANELWLKASSRVAWLLAHLHHGSPLTWPHRESSFCRWSSCHRLSSH